MTDTRVLKLLGVQPKIGTKFTVTYQIGGEQSEPKTVTQEFVLSGWWDYNGVSQASNVIVPESYVKKTLQNVEIGEDEESGNGHLTLCLGMHFISKKYAAGDQRLWISVRRCF